MRECCARSCAGGGCFYLNSGWSLSISKVHEGLESAILVLLSLAIMKIETVGCLLHTWLKCGPLVGCCGELHLCLTNSFCCGLKICCCCLLCECLILHCL